jgi:hypothetical protein
MHFCEYFQNRVHNDNAKIQMNVDTTIRLNLLSINSPLSDIYGNINGLEHERNAIVRLHYDNVRFIRSTFFDLHVTGAAKE